MPTPHRSAQHALAAPRQDTSVSACGPACCLRAPSQRHLHVLSPAGSLRATMPEHVDVLKITNDDAAFVLGKNGKTKEKIARVSGAELDLFEQQLKLEIRGTEEERKKAKKYVECVMAQRVGPVKIDDNTEDDDLTVIRVPSEAVGFVTGAQGNFLRQVEEEWGTLMFFADFRGRGERQEVSARWCAVHENQMIREPRTWR